MYKITQGQTHGMKDVQIFIDIINTLDRYQIIQAHSFFNRNQEIIISRAPGRLDVMGGIADYSGSLVLQLPLKEATFAAVQLGSDNLLRILSLTDVESEKSRYFEMSVGDFIGDGKATDYPSARRYFQNDHSIQWAAYIAGIFLVLMKERKIQFHQGASILIYSNVPEGKGVSSSAALEVAAMSSVAKAFHISIAPRELAMLCQKVENFIVGAPCGVMDQMTAVLGRENQLLALLCQPAELEPFISIPDGICFWGIDSGIKHSVSGADYASVRIGTFMGYRILLTLMETQTAAGFHRFQMNYLVNVPPSIYEQYFSEKIPLQLKGSEFIRRYHCIDDHATEIVPDKLYSVRQPTAHPIYEHFRVRNFTELVQKPMTDIVLELLGEFMFQSHSSYSACGLGSKATDRIVELDREFGARGGLFGAKITGGGSGGTVVLLGRAAASESIEGIVEKYSSETGFKPYVFSGSSMGANEFGYLKLDNIVQ